MNKAFAFAALLAGVTSEANQPSCELSPDISDLLPGLALDIVRQEYPNNIAHLLFSDDDAQVPSQLHPVFYGCYDWHSAVHTHWQLLRLSRSVGEDDVARIDAYLDTAFNQVDLANEALYFEGRTGYQRPYGVVWLLQLVAELNEMDREGHALAGKWRAYFEPLEERIVGTLSEWLPKLSHPIRTGEHSQSAFAMGLAIDYATEVGNMSFLSLLLDRAWHFHGGDIGCALHLEPGGHDFLSPCLASADLMRRVLNPRNTVLLQTSGKKPPSSTTFGAWLTVAVPAVVEYREGDPLFLDTVEVIDPTDGKLAHFDGLNLSRAWMLEGMLHALEPNDKRRQTVLLAAEAHKTKGLEIIDADMDYMGSHWLGSYAVYLETCRGL